MVALPRLELGLRASKAPVLDRYTTGLTKKEQYDSPNELFNYNIS
jgi:hypothetical protein